MTIDKDNQIHVRKAFPQSPAAVYAVLADEDFFDFCGANVDDGRYDFRVGGGYSYKVDEDDFLEGEFRAIEPLNKIAFTWLTMGLDGPTGETLVTLALTDDGGRCVVDLTHTGLKHRKTARAHEAAWIEVLEAIGEELAEEDGK